LQKIDAEPALSDEPELLARGELTDRSFDAPRLRFLAFRILDPTDV